jgi:hypothetical protein
MGPRYDSRCLLTISFTPGPFRRALRDELLLILAPTGQRLSAKGWRGATTLGNDIFLRADLDERELSVSLYHEVLEAATVAADQPPEAVLELNEAEFETAAQSAHTRPGIASPASLNQMLAEFGF